MKSKILKTFICLLAAVVLFCGAIPASAEGSAESAQGVINGILEYKNASSIQNWIDGDITKKAGVTSEWYVVALSQYGSYSFGNYEKALLKFLADTEVPSASSRQKYALALMAAGSTNEYIYSTLNDSIGELGVMSWVYGLHLLNNGYESTEFTLNDVKSKLLSLQNGDGGWSVMSGSVEVDTTAMAVQALAPYYKNEAAVKTAVDRALTFLSAQQKSGGDYSNYGVNNAESTAQVLVALSSLGIDAGADSRFIKNGNTIFDGISLYRLSNKSYCHEQGKSFSENATVQVFYSMVSYLRMKNGQSPLYILDNAPAYKDLKIPESKPQSSSDVSTSVSSVISSTQSVASSVIQNSSSQTTSNTTVSDTSKTTESTVSEESIGTMDTESDTETSSKTQVNEKDDEKHSVEKKKKGISYKVWAILAIVLIAVGVCALLYFLKLGNKSNYILVAAIAVVLVAIVLFTNFQTVDNHYNSSEDNQNTIGTVTITIRCDTVPDKSAEHIPDNGVILDTVEHPLEAGDTVYDILLEVATENKIQLDMSGDADTVYVRGLNNIYEFDFGDASGWIYHVNGEAPSISCGEYELLPNDKIEWLYSCDLGNDLQ